jgi:hypothetical protein
MSTERWRKLADDLDKADLYGSRESFVHGDCSEGLREVCAALDKAEARAAVLLREALQHTKLEEWRKDAKRTKAAFNGCDTGGNFLADIILKACDQHRGA